MLMKHDMIRALLAAALLSLGAVACDKPYEMNLPLAVNQHLITLQKEAGSTHILVWSDGGWSARFDKPIDWGSLNKATGEGNSDIVFTYSTNYGISRTVGLVLERGELRDTIQINQDGPYTITGESGHTDFGVNFNAATTALIQPGAKIRAPFKSTVPYTTDSYSVMTEFLAEDGSSQGVVTFGQEVPDTMKVTPWLTVEEIQKDAVIYTVTDNNSGALRTAVITLRASDAKGEHIQTTCTVLQGIQEAAFDLETYKAEFVGAPGAGSIPSKLNENNIYAYENNISYETDADWILTPKLTGEGLTFSLALNDTGAPRQADLKVTYTDEAGGNISRTVTVVQRASFTFEDVRNLPAGLINEDQIIDGYIVSSPESANNCQNLQIAQFKFDFKENARTAIYQSLDGKLGFMLKFEDPADNTLPRYTRLRLQIKGLTLVKGANPVTYTLTGVTQGNIYGTLEPNAKLPVKARNIDDLTDDDINTLVDLMDVEIMCKDGAYTNATEGYSIKDVTAGINVVSGGGSPRWDTVPLLMSDRGGSTIYMLTNSYVPWRRRANATQLGEGLWEAGTDNGAVYDKEGNVTVPVVPQGSGTFRGIITSETLVRYGEIGRYQIRAIEEGDIQLKDPAFSTTLVEWNWNNKLADALPEKGDGTLDFHGATLAAASDFNNTVMVDKKGASNQKGLIPSCALKVTNSWWDFTNDVGKYFDVSFSTAGIRGTNIVFGITWNHGAMGNTTLDSPAHWKLLYSIDGGASFKDVPGEIIKNRSIVWWTTTSQDSCPGFKDHLRALPNECFNCEKVIVRVQVADKVTDTKPDTAAATYLTNLGIEQGTLTTLLHNLKTAARAGVKSTGNASKAGYSAPVRVSPANFYLKPGAKDLDGLMAEMDSGLVITSLAGLHAGANPLSGDFSLMAEGYTVNHGKKDRPVERITVAGNFYELLKSIRALGSDLKFSDSAIGSPSADVGEMTIAG